MYEKISTAGMGREEWLKLRKSGIGGSDAGAICGVNPYSCPMKVFKDKISEDIEELDSEAVRIGHDLENYVAQRFSEAAGLKVRRSNFMYRSKEHPFMIADVDRLVIGEDAGLECKTASAYNAEKWKDGSIPLHYIMQCYHYMAVLHKKTWYIAALILGKGFTYRRLAWDDEIISRLIMIEEDFWNNHVAKDVMPRPDGSKSCDEAIRQYFHTAKKADAVELAGFEEKLKRREEIISAVEKLQTEQKRIEQEVKLAMGDNEAAVSGNYRISWGNVDSVRIDAKRIKAEMPEIYAGFSKVSHSRRFEVRVA